MFGSRAFVGDDLTALEGRVGVDGMTLAEAMRERGFDFALVGQAKAIDGVGCYLELHIEPGPRMQTQSLDTAVVTAIVGIGGYRVVLRGQTNHAGTTPMAERHDAMAGASRVVLQLRDAALSTPDVTANIGRIEIRPGGHQRRAGRGRVLRRRTHGEPGKVRRPRGTRPRHGGRSRRRGADGRDQRDLRAPSRADDTHLQELLGREMESQGLAWASLGSGAGHDAQVLAQHVPTGMLFVPSEAGVSHSPEEFTAPELREPGVRF